MTSDIHDIYDAFTETAVVLKNRDTEIWMSCWQANALSRHIDYEMSSSFRHQMNVQRRVEPKDINELPL
jgi:putative SOS response-associated peptidase YedK